MSTTLFYNTLTRDGAIAELNGNEILTSKVLPSGHFSSWTHIVRIDHGMFAQNRKLFLYNQYDQTGAIGYLDDSDLTIAEHFPHGTLALWTHIVASGNLLFFYNQLNGAAAIATTAPKQVTIEKVHAHELEAKLAGHLPDIKAVEQKPAARSKNMVTLLSFGAGSFGHWTHVVSSGSYLFFYDQNSGAGSLNKVSEEAPTTVAEMVNGSKASFTTVKEFKKGALGSWSHIVGAAPYLLFYNQSKRSGRFSKVSENGVDSVREYAANSFGSWTHMVTGQTLYQASAVGTPFKKDGAAILFYDADTKGAALGKLHQGSFKTVQSYKPGSLGAWTTISDSATAPNSYDVGYTLKRSDSKIQLLSHDGGMSEVDVSDKELTPEQQAEALDMIWKSIVDFVGLNAEDIKSGRIKAADLGGAIYGIAASVIVLLLAPWAGVGLLGKVVATPFIEASKQIGRYYGSMTDDLLAALKGESEATMTQIVATLATVHLIAFHLPGAAILGRDAWSLTRDIGAKLGEVAEDTVNSIIDVVGDVAGAGAAVVGDVLDFIGL